MGLSLAGFIGRAMTMYPRETSKMEVSNCHPDKAGGFLDVRFYWNLARVVGVPLASLGSPTSADGICHV